MRDDVLLVTDVTQDGRADMLALDVSYGLRLFRQG